MTTTPTAPPTDDNGVADLAIMLAEVEARSAVDLLAAIFGNHRLALPIVEAAGIEHRDFSEADHRRIYLAIEHHRHGEKVDALRLAKQILQAEQLWLPSEIAGNYRMMRHSDATLSHLASIERFDPQLIAERAAALLDVRRRRHRLERLATEMEEIASGTGATAVFEQMEAAA